MIHVCMCCTVFCCMHACMYVGVTSMSVCRYALSVRMMYCMYVCMYVYVCMYACMYACMHVCMYACMHASTCIMYICMCVYMYPCMYVCMNVYMCVRTICMYVVCSPHGLMEKACVCKKGCDVRIILLNRKGKCAFCGPYIPARFHEFSSLH
jgi:hypothetical protein